MARKYSVSKQYCRVNGSNRQIVGGYTKIAGVNREIWQGATLINGTSKKINFVDTSALALFEDVVLVSLHGRDSSTAGGCKFDLAVDAANVSIPYYLVAFNGSYYGIYKIVLNSSMQGVKTDIIDQFYADVKVSTGETIIRCFLSNDGGSTQLNSNGGALLALRFPNFPEFRSDAILRSLTHRYATGANSEMGNVTVGLGSGYFENTLAFIRSGSYIAITNFLSTGASPTKDLFLSNNTSYPDLLYKGADSGHWYASDNNTQQRHYGANIVCLSY